MADQARPEAVGADQEVSDAPPTQRWLLMLLRAIVALLLGLVVLISEKTRPALGNVIGAYWMIGSLLSLRWVHRNRGMAGNRIVSAAAVIGTVAGALVLLRFVLRHILSVNMVLALLGATAILTGLLRLSGTFRDHVIADRPRYAHRVALGTLELALGVALILPHDATGPVAIAAGLWGIVVGAIMLVDALALRRVRRPVGHGQG